MTPCESIFLFLRFFNSCSGSVMDKKMAYSPVERPTFFEIFKAHCSESGTASLQQIIFVRVAPLDVDILCTSAVCSIEKHSATP